MRRFWLGDATSRVHVDTGAVRVVVSSTFGSVELSGLIGLSSHDLAPVQCREVVHADGLVPLRTR